MTQVLYDVEGDLCRLAVEGHATGSRVVCAAVSGLVTALDGYLRNAGEHIYREQRRQVGPGRAVFAVRGDGEVRAAFQMAAIGLMQIGKTYPEQVKMR